MEWAGPLAVSCFSASGQATPLSDMMTFPPTLVVDFDRIVMCLGPARKVTYTHLRDLDKQQQPACRAADGRCCELARPGSSAIGPPRRRPALITWHPPWGGEMSVTDGPNLVWRRSTASGATGDCVEVAHATGLVLIRDSKEPRGPTLRFSASEWAAFLAGVRNGEFDVPRC